MLRSEIVNTLRHTSMCVFNKPVALVTDTLTDTRIQEFACNKSHFQIWFALHVDYKGLRFLWFFHAVWCTAVIRNFNSFEKYPWILGVTFWFYLHWISHWNRHNFYTRSYAVTFDVKWYSRQYKHRQVRTNTGMSTGVLSALGTSRMPELNNRVDSPQSSPLEPSWPIDMQCHGHLPIRWTWTYPWT